MIHVTFILAPDEFPKLYREQAVERVRQQATVTVPVIPGHDWTAHRAALARTDVIFSGWGAPLMDAEFLRAVPRLKTVFYAAGSVRYFTTDAFWQRGIRITSAQALNAIPVAEFTSAAILLGLKRFWPFARATRTHRTFDHSGPVAGAYRTVVGLVSYGTIARLVRQRLLASEVRVVVYDPFLSEAEARAENIQLVALDELFATADAVSLHTPHRAETAGMIRGRHFAAMKPGAVFINTARGEIVNEPEMIAQLFQRPDLQAVLDVTAPEPPVTDSPLYSLPNVVLTPHIAGSLGGECHRMGDAMVDEFGRYLKGDTLRWELSPTKVAVMA